MHWAVILFVVHSFSLLLVLNSQCLGVQVGSSQHTRIQSRTSWLWICIRMGHSSWHTARICVYSTMPSSVGASKSGLQTVFVYCMVEITYNHLTLSLQHKSDKFNFYVLSINILLLHSSLYYTEIYVHLHLPITVN